MPNDVLRLSSGDQAGEYRFVEAYDPATGTGTLIEPYSHDQAGASVGRGKTMNGLVVALSVLRKTGSGFEMGQFQDGHRNFVLAHNAFFSQPMCLTFRNKNKGHGHRNHVQLFNLYTRLDADTPELPRDGLRIERNHFLSGRSRGEAGKLGGHALRFDGDTRYAPFEGQQTVGAKPLIPFDAFGRPITASSPVGAIVA
jgi:hypothetical protein